MNKILVTGGCGFIGSNFIEYLTHKYPCEIINVDSLDIGGYLENISEWTRKSGRYTFHRADITDADAMKDVFEKHTDIDCVVNFAAHTHVDRSLVVPTNFALTNVVGTQIVLNEVIRHDIPRFVQISTDEVYGSTDDDSFKETYRLHPNNPYSATKAGAEMLVKAAIHSFGVNAVITRSSNNYGPRQYHEKLVPMIIDRALNDQPVTVFNDGKAVREWTHVLDNCIAVDTVMRNGKIGGVYNIGSGIEKRNIDIVKAVLKLLNKPEDLIQYTVDRINDDRRYSLDSTKIRNELGWSNKIQLEEGLATTVKWYIEKSVVKNY